MSKAIFIWLLLLVSMSARADGCALPAATPTEPYATLAGLSTRDFQLLLNEYMFLHGWTKHSEAVSAGFRFGNRVYGEVLKAGGQFSPKTVAAWRRAYTSSGRAQFLAGPGSKIDMAAVDRAVVDWILGVCLGSRLWSEVRAINECRFVFAAGLAPSNAPDAIVQPARLQVRGGRCQPWPRRPLSTKGDSVQCVRSGEGAVTVELVTDQAGATRQALPALKHPTLPPEPQETRKLSEPASEVVSLWRSRDYHLQQLGRGCPSCELYAADVQPSMPGAVILRAETVSSNGAGWHRCPAGFRCGVYEFSPPDNSRVSGCRDVSVCRVWRLAETSAEASDVIQLTYQTSEVVCTNCPDKVDFETAHKKWQEARDAAPGRCEVFPDSPAQSIGPAAKN
jgi:hypothetical protein